MVGTSLAMAPAFVLGQLCDVVDLDGPIFLAAATAVPGVDLRRRPGLVPATRCGARRRASRMSAQRAATWFGQPRGLTILFLTNMWEQFSYYGMRALLVYYMTKQLLFGAGEGVVHLRHSTPRSPISRRSSAASIADRWLGKRRAVIIGAQRSWRAGHFMMAFEPLFYFALATIALGNGLFLPSLPSQINDLYARRRSAARLGVQRLLRRHEHRRLPRAAGLRHAGRDVRLALRFRRRRHRHARRARRSILLGRRYLPPRQAPRCRGRSAAASAAAAIAAQAVAAAARRRARGRRSSAAPTSRSATRFALWTDTRRRPRRRRRRRFR